ncbi:MAG: metalloregulator ArsR/SmtB family transcription factor [Candidatus Aenigmarchaeota archaeon]|nr:metalloregulator ArsR/SmtB family transcription factor [Candidatus Aenigmarchaeota archaeon]
MKEALKIFKALSDETRLKIIEFLLDGEKCVCEIVPYTKRTQSTVSIQLSKLEGLGIVESRREGKNVYYRIVNPKIKKILSKIDFSKWWDVDRKEIDWYPIIDESKCIGCGMCIVTCGRGVFEYDKSKNKSKVKNPFNCMVGCDNCRIYCPTGAISFPQKNRREFIQSLLKKYDILVKAREKVVE